MVVVKNTQIKLNFRNLLHNFYFLSPMYGKDCNVFGLIFEDFDRFTHFKFHRIRKSHIKDLCVCICVTVISITQKQVMAETANLIYYTSIIWRCYSKLGTIRQTVCLEGYAKKFSAYGRNFLLVRFSNFRLH